MNKLRKFIQCAKLRRFVLGEIGKNNHFRPGVMVTSAAKIGSNNYFGDRVMVCLLYTSNQLKVVQASLLLKQRMKRQHDFYMSREKE